MERSKHATNAELLEALRQAYPDVSATTVHRVTARMHERGRIGLAPPTEDGSIRYDANAGLHHHFMCKRCRRLKDLELPQTCVTQLEQYLGGCKIRGPLTIQGVCEKCEDKGE